MQGTIGGTTPRDLPEPERVRMDLQDRTDNTSLRGKSGLPQVGTNEDTRQEHRPDTSFKRKRQAEEGGEGIPLASGTQAEKEPEDSVAITEDDEGQEETLSPGDGEEDEGGHMGTSPRSPPQQRGRHRVTFSACGEDPPECGAMRCSEARKEEAREQKPAVGEADARDKALSGLLKQVSKGWEAHEQSEVALRLHAVLSSEASFLSNRRSEKAPAHELRRYPMPKLSPPERGEQKGPERSISGEEEVPERCSACDTESAEQSTFLQGGIVRCRQCDRLLFEPGHSAFSRVEAQKDVRTKTGPIDIEELHYDPGNETIRKWLAAAEISMQDMYQGRKPKPPQDVRLTQKDMPKWARGVVWDCTNPKDCKPVKRSGKGDMPPGRRISAENMRRGAEEIGWTDTDILDQLDTGLEARSGCALDTVLAFHHKGLIQSFEPAKKIIERDIEQGWVAKATPRLPYVPCRLTPRNVVKQTKWKITTKPDGTPEIDEEGNLVVEENPKYRVSTDSSWGPLGGDAPNDGCLRGDVVTGLPTVRALGESVSIIGEAGTMMEPEAYAIDFKDAYRHAVVQREDWWEQCFIWLGGVCVERRGVFGARWMPNRFQRIARLALAIAIHECKIFDRNQPFLEGWLSEEWRKRPTDESRPAFAMIYIDDTTGVGTSDPVTAPTSTTVARPIEDGPASPKEVGVDEAGVRKAGGTPAKGCQAGSRTMSRACAHAKICIFVYTWLHLPVSVGKCGVGSKIELLGTIIDCPARKIRPPAAKAFGICQELATLRRNLTSLPRGKPSGDDAGAQRHHREDRNVVRKANGRCVSRYNNNQKGMSQQELDDLLEQVLGRLISLSVAIPNCSGHLADLMRAESMYVRSSRMIRAAGRRAEGIQTFLQRNSGQARELIVSASTWFATQLRDCGRFAAMPGASRRRFPTPNGKECVLWASDASGVASEGFGAWTVVRHEVAEWIARRAEKKKGGEGVRWFGGSSSPDGSNRRRSRPRKNKPHAFVLVADVWPAWAQEAGELMISSNTAEAIGRLAVAYLMQGAPGTTHVVWAGDSMVVKGAAEKGRSPAPAMDVVIRETAIALKGTQSIAAQLPREYNQRADDLSKRLMPEVALAIERMGDNGVIVPIPEELEDIVRRATERTRRAAKEKVVITGPLDGEPNEKRPKVSWGPSPDGSGEPPGEMKSQELGGLPPGTRA